MTIKQLLVKGKYYLALCTYYVVGMRVPNRLGGQRLRRILVKHIAKECGKNVRISENVYFGMGNNLVLKDYSGIGPGCKIYGKAIVTIGSGNIMGPDVMIVTGDHMIGTDVDGSFINDLLSGDITIGEESFVGARTTILKNVTIGRRAVVGACSLVNADVPANTMYAGIPARKIKDL